MPITGEKAKAILRAAVTRRVFTIDNADVKSVDYCVQFLYTLIDDEILLLK